MLSDEAYWKLKEVQVKPRCLLGRARTSMVFEDEEDEEDEQAQAETH